MKKSFLFSLLVLMAGSQSVNVLGMDKCSNLCGDARKKILEHKTVSLYGLAVLTAPIVAGFVGMSRGQSFKQGVSNMFSFIQSNAKEHPYRSIVLGLAMLSHVFYFEYWSKDNKLLEMKKTIVSKVERK